MMQEDKKWGGYTLEELRYRRLLSSAKIEVSKAMLASQVKQATTASGLMNKVTGALNYMDYALIAFRIGKKIYSFFKK